MKRKDFIKKGILGAAALGTAGLISGCNSETSHDQTALSPNINFNKTFEWRMTTVWGKNFPVLGEAANMLADTVQKMSGGRMNIKIFGTKATGL